MALEDDNVLSNVFGEKGPHAHIEREDAVLHEQIHQWDLDRDKECTV
eukprot:CAMPEP_0170544192 /NCGR_PEP_ID=MMETSP0211-20121228/3051_1 /TAXON_ID=311385 /ORGANISM="Pseudokeronopsis sp., Strain OXSARD2" /LENGTH=46 /DNA_ID= /DNA_START= /DNA_END= /DNA_ORIENTATION=